MVSFHDITQLSQLTAVKMSPKDQQVLIKFSNVYGRPVPEKSGRKETTMTKASIVMLMYHSDDKTCSDTHVSLTQTMNESDREQTIVEE